MSGVYDCVVFDLDGTIIDSHAYTFDAFRHALAPYDECPTDEEIYASFGPSERVILDDFIAAGDVARAYERLQAWYRAHASRAQPHPDMLEVLESLRQQGIAITLFTGRGMDSTRLLLETHDLDRFFDAVIAGDSPVQPKPSGEGLTALLQAVHCSAQRCLVVGDSPLDLQAAHQVGAHAIGASWFPARSVAPLEGPTLSSPRDLLRLFRAG